MPRWPKRNPRPGVDKYGRTLLWYLAASGDVVGANKAVAGGADPAKGDDVGYTPLHVAAQNGHLSMIQFLIKVGANPNAIDKHGNGPLWTATMSNSQLETKLAIIRALLDAGANPHHKNVAGRSPGDMANTIGNGIEGPFVERILRTVKFSVWLMLGFRVVSKQIFLNRLFL